MVRNCNQEIAPPNYFILNKGENGRFFQLKGSNCPHYDGEIDRRPSYQKLIAITKIKPGIATDDGVEIRFIDQEIQRIVSSRPDAKAYKVYYDKKILEVELETKYLGCQNEQSFPQKL